MLRLTTCTLILFGLFSNFGCEEFRESDDSDETSRYYTAAVMELNAAGDKFHDPQQIIDANLNEYIKWIQEAKEKDVDILVFPEATFNYNGIDTREDLLRFAIELPEEVSTGNYGCDYSSNSLLNELSEVVANASIYVLVNIVECEQRSDDIALFNTNIVFDRSGCIVSRYRKFNLFIEPLMNVTDEPEMSIFDTDFEVTFGHFICFDILFKAPALDLIALNVSHILYPSMWFSETPFLVSTQLQQSYAFRNNIVLLSSGTNAPSNSNTGSGIYVGRHGGIDSIISYRSESKMIVARVPKDVNDPQYRPEMSAIKQHYTPTEMNALKLWSHLPASVLTYPLKEGSIIHENGLVCEFTLDFTKASTEADEVHGYRLIAFNGIRNYANITNGGEIYCAIVSCLDESDPTTCGQRFAAPSVLFHSIKIQATLRGVDDDGDDSSRLIMPTSLDFSINPLSMDEFEFAIDESDEGRSYVIESTGELNEILTFGIYGRNFAADNTQMIAEEEDDEAEDELSAATFKGDDELDILEGEEPHQIKEKHRGQGDMNVVLIFAIYVPLMIVLCIIAAILVYRRLKDPYKHPLVIMRRKSEMQTA